MALDGQGITASNGIEGVLLDIGLDQSHGQVVGIGVVGVVRRPEPGHLDWSKRSEDRRRPATTPTSLLANYFGIMDVRGVALTTRWSSPLARQALLDLDAYFPEVRRSDPQGRAVNATYSACCAADSCDTLLVALRYSLQSNPFVGKLATK